MPKSASTQVASEQPFHALLGKLAIGDAPSHLGWLMLNYDNRAQVPTAQAQLDDWAIRSAHTRAEYASQQRCALDMAYGPHNGETLDVFWPTNNKTKKPNKPNTLRRVVVFIHGGYWRSLDKADYSFVVPTLERSVSAKGAVVVMLNYSLCPAVEIDDIAMQLTRAMAWVFEHIHRYGGDATKVSVVGHSAGGHLATMMLGCLWQHVHTSTGQPLPKHWIRRALSVSGLYDLAPLQHAPFIQQDLHLTMQTIERCSPAYWPQPGKGKLLTVVGADETAEFARHNGMMRQVWGSKRVPVSAVIEGLNHFSIVEALANAHPRVCELLAQLRG